MFDTKPTWFLGALLLSALAPAQQQPAQQQPAPGSAAKQEFDQLVKDYGTAQQQRGAKRRQELEAAKAEGKAPPPLPAVGLGKEWLPKFQAGAAKYKGTDDAVPFLVWIGNNDREQRRAMLDTLLSDHIRSPALAGAIRLITSQATMATSAPVQTAAGNAPQKADTKDREAERQAAEATVREMLGKVIEQNPSPDVQAQALLARANLVLGSRAATTAEARQSALADVRAGFTRAVDKDVKAQCEGILYEQEHLAIGMTAPEIEGNDLDGVAFKLSDYRGKVILLDFWGYW